MFREYLYPTTTSTTISGDLKRLPLTRALRITRELWVCAPSSQNCQLLPSSQRGPNDVNSPSAHLNPLQPGSPRRSRAEGGLGDGGIGGFGVVGGSPRASGSGGWPYDRASMTDEDKVRWVSAILQHSTRAILFTITITTTPSNLGLYCPLLYPDPNLIPTQGRSLQVRCRGDSRRVFFVG